MEGKIRLAVFGQKRLSREGGIEIVVKELCTRMAQNGCDITCYNRAGHHVSGAEYDKTIEYDGIRQKVVPTIEKKGLAAVSSSFFAALYSAFGRYDVVHIHAEGPAFFCWIPKLFGKRVISTIHGLDWAREKWKFGVGSKFIRQGEKNAVKYADEIIVLSKGVQKYFMETYGRETHFIPNGVNRPEVREAKLITDHFGLEKDSYILFLGRLVPEKGIRYLVEAFKNVKTDKKLVIAGGSSDTDSFMEELKELAKGDDRILFTGFVQGAMLDELYSNAYIYTLPSDLEGMPLSLLEAMSYGNCCLVSDIPECAEVVEDKALIIIFVLVYGRMIEIYLMTSLAPLPVATLSNRELGGTGQNYLKSLFAVGFQGMLILVCVAIYAVLIQGIATGGDPIGAIWGTVGYTVLLCFMLFKTGGIAQRIFGAH